MTRRCGHHVTTTTSAILLQNFCIDFPIYMHIYVAPVPSTHPHSQSEYSKAIHVSDQFLVSSYEWQSVIVLLMARCGAACLESGEHSPLSRVEQQKPNWPHMQANNNISSPYLVCYKGTASCSPSPATRRNVFTGTITPLPSSSRAPRRDICIRRIKYS